MARTDPFLETDDEAIRLAKILVRTARFGALATIDPEDGAPLATRVAIATQMDGTPLILVSILSAHRQALEADARCSILVGEPGKGDPLAHPRLTIKAVAERIDRQTPTHPDAERRYLNRHPKAKLYAGFADFAFFRLVPQGALLNGGFGKAYRLQASELLLDGSFDQFLQLEQSALDHMNEDHADAVESYAVGLAGASPGKWRLIGIDPEGIDLALGDETRRVFFDFPLKNAEEVRPALISLARKARGN